MSTCPTCEGKGGWYEDSGTYEFCGPWNDCPRCHKSGKVSWWNILVEHFWYFVLGSDRLTNWYIHLRGWDKVE